MFESTQQLLNLWRSWKCPSSDKLHAKEQSAESLVQLQNWKLMTSAARCGMPARMCWRMALMADYDKDFLLYTDGLKGMGFGVALRQVDWASDCVSFKEVIACREKLLGDRTQHWRSCLGDIQVKALLGWWQICSIQVLLDICAVSGKRVPHSVGGFISPSLVGDSKMTSGKRNRKEKPLIMHLSCTYYFVSLSAFSTTMCFIYVFPHQIRSLCPPWSSSCCQIRLFFKQPPFQRFCVFVSVERWQHIRLTLRLWESSKWSIFEIALMHIWFVWCYSIQSMIFWSCTSSTNMEWSGYAPWCNQGWSALALISPSW